MSDLKYQDECELLRRLKSNRKYRDDLEQRIEGLERDLGKLRSHLGGAEEQGRWIVKYLSEKP